MDESAAPQHAAARPGLARTEAPAQKPVRISGLSAVAALFATQPERVERLFFEPGIGSRASAFCKAMAAARKPYKQVPLEELARVAGTERHGSIVALAAPIVVPILDPIGAVTAAAAWGRTGDSLLVLDGVSNPHNLGAIARTAAFFGVRRLLLSDHPAQALPSDAAYRVARGGLEHLALYQARDLAAVLRALSATYRIVGAALGEGQPPETFSGDARPIALVMGNEEDGLGAATRAACDDIVTIPGAAADRMQSLNVAASSAILIHAMLQPPVSRD
jgi:RNA methyltransferase, TrmH family